MSTPSGAAMADATKGGAPSSGVPPGGSNGAPPAGSQGFWSGWTQPEQKETRDWAANKAYADPYVLARSARDWEREAATLRAGKGYPEDKPGADGKPARDENAWKAWNALVGVPEKADQYDIPLPENNPYPQFKAYMAEELHKAGVPARMAPALARGYESAVARLETELRAQEDAKSTEGLRQIEQEWGANYRERMAVADRARAWIAKETGGLDEVQMRTLEAVLGTPKWLTMLWKIGSGNQEAVFAGDGGSPRSFQGGASEAQARLDQITADRASGKLSDQAWRELTKKGGEYDALVAEVAKGFAPPPG